MSDSNKDTAKTQRIVSSPDGYLPGSNPFLHLDASLLDKLQLIAQRSNRSSLEFVEDWIIGLPDPDRKNVSKILKSSAETIADVPSFTGSIEVFCTACEKGSKITALFAGQTIPCPHCRATVHVPK